MSEAQAVLPPKPWSIMVTARADKYVGNGHVYICDANGRKIMSLWGAPREKMEMVELIIKAREALP